MHNAYRSKVICRGKSGKKFKRFNKFYCKEFHNEYKVRNAYNGNVKHYLTLKKEMKKNKQVEVL